MKSPNILLSLVAAVTVTFGFSTSAVQGQESCGGDNNGDGLVNGVDLAIVLGAWGVCPGTAGVEQAQLGLFKRGHVIDHRDANR